MDRDAIEEIEVALLLEAVFRRYGYDFRHYSKASIQRRVKHFMARSSVERIADVTARLLHDQEFFQRLIEDFSVPVTEMFRDPDVYAFLRREVVPFLRTYPFLKVWHAGCASGEEVYSLAILLKEEGLYDRTTIYATDFNEVVLDKARSGIYHIRDVKKYLDNYRRAGGTGSLHDYFDAHYDSVIMAKALKKNITFARHNLASDQVFGEMHLILCRNVLIYFDRSLQNRVLNLFDESLVRCGFLCLGKKETLRFSEVRDRFLEVSSTMQVYRKKCSDEDVLMLDKTASAGEKTLP
ncbi:MAG: protein-glutamate O-methyltransferase CheR [Desulfobulbaceae bacterium]|nr:protein-glutamate O-methyltransferase CheR [Desulfobulbaceae bacterium]